MKKMTILFSVVAVSLFAFGCAHKKSCDSCKMGDEKAAHLEAGKAKAVTALTSAKGQKVSGTVTFTQEGETTRIVGEIKGLKKSGKHGFHIHEFGDCSSPDFTSAGGHFNPDGTQHGNLTDAQKHAGDMGNIEADAKGVAKIDLIVKNMPVNKGIAGRSLVIHEKEDDLKSQPSGNAGSRLACGIIGTSNF